jgi:hypothetical protein
LGFGGHGDELLVRRNGKARSRGNTLAGLIEISMGTPRKRTSFFDIQTCDGPYVIEMIGEKNILDFARDL